MEPTQEEQTQAKQGEVNTTLSEHSCVTQNGCKSHRAILLAIIGVALIVAVLYYVNTQRTEEVSISLVPDVVSTEPTYTEEDYLNAMDTPLPTEMSVEYEEGAMRAAMDEPL